MIKQILFCSSVLMLVLACGQHVHTAKTNPESSGIMFKDTIGYFVFDSVSNDLGNIVPENSRLIKHFKYIGTDSVYIVRPWTGDPHLICEYPSGVLIPNKIYAFTVCFAHQGRQGNMSRHLGFELSDGNRITLRFAGKYIPIQSDN